MKIDCNSDVVGRAEEFTDLSASRLPGISTSRLDISEITLSELLSLIDSFRSCMDDVEPVFAADLDGTLWAGDIAHLVIDYAVKNSLFLPAIDRRLRNEFAGYELKQSQSNNSDRARTENVERLLSYMQGQIEAAESFREKNQRTRDLYQANAWIFAGYTDSELQEIANAAFASGAGPQLVFDSAKTLIEELASLNVSTHVFSASLEPFVEVVSRELGVASACAHGMQLERRGGVYLPVVKSPVMFGTGKAERLHLEVESEEDIGLPKRVLLAMGDSPEGNDAALLRSAAIAVGVNPKTLAKLEALADITTVYTRTFQLRLPAKEK